MIFSFICFPCTTFYFFCSAFAIFFLLFRFLSPYRWHHRRCHRFVVVFVIVLKSFYCFHKLRPLTIVSFVLQSNDIVCMKMSRQIKLLQRMRRNDNDCAHVFSHVEQSNYSEFEEITQFEAPHSLVIVGLCSLGRPIRQRQSQQGQYKGWLNENNSNSNHTLLRVRVGGAYSSFDFRRLSFKIIRAAANAMMSFHLCLRRSFHYFFVDLYFIIYSFGLTLYVHSGFVCVFGQNCSKWHSARGIVLLSLDFRRHVSCVFQFSFLLSLIAWKIESNQMNRMYLRLF